MTYVSHEELSWPEAPQNIRHARVITEEDMQWGLHKDDRDQYTGHTWYVEVPHRSCCWARTHQPVLYLSKKCFVESAPAAVATLLIQGWERLPVSGPQPGEGDIGAVIAQSHARLVLPGLFQVHNEDFASLHWPLLCLSLTRLHWTGMGPTFGQLKVNLS